MIEPVLDATCLMIFSVLIAAYRADQFMPTALASIAQQTHGDWELIVVEDGSRGATESLVSAFAAANPTHVVRYENLGKNCGVAVARNRLLALARGDTVAFLDADDYWHASHLANLAESRSAGATLVFSGLELWDGDQSRLLGTYVPPAHYLRQPRLYLFQHSFIQTSSCVALDRALIARAGWIDETLRSTLR